MDTALSSILFFFAGQLSASCHAPAWPDLNSYLWRLAAQRGERGGVSMWPPSTTSHTHPRSCGSAPAPTQLWVQRRYQAAHPAAALVLASAFCTTTTTTISNHLSIYLTIHVPISLLPPLPYLSPHLQSYAVFSFGSYIRLAALALLGSPR